jgi:histidyl-tRNA synthetase
MEIKLSKTYKGTRILFKESAKSKRKLINEMITIMESYGYDEIMIPIIQMSESFISKVGDENRNMMFQFKDRGDRDICLSPEYTAIVQQLSKERFKFEKDVKMFYVGECFRGERPQSGRWRQFTQFGVEILNPTKDYTDELVEIAKRITELITLNYEVNLDASRGLDYYNGGKGFEISCPELGAAKQICGGGSYEGGAGFAIGLDRILLIKNN